MSTGPFVTFLGGSMVICWKRQGWWKACSDLPSLMVSHRTKDGVLKKLQAAVRAYYRRKP